MPLDYRLAMAAPQERFGTLKDIMAIGQLHDQDRQQQQARIDADQQRQADLIVQQTLQKHADRPEDAILELRQRGFAKPAMALETHLSEIKQKAMAARKTELEAAKLDLENRGVHPDQGIKQIETELKLIAARNPKEVLEGIATSRNQEDLDHWLNAAKIVLPRGSEALIATFPTTWTPEVPTWAAQQAMGAKEVANNALQTRGQDMTAQTAAAGQAVTTRGQDISAATQQRGQNMAAATAAAGQATTRRGQDMTDKRAAAALGPDGKPINLSVSQKDDIVTIDDLTGLIADSQTLGKKIGWKGVGALGAGTISQTLAQYGKGTEEEEVLRNYIGNIQGTIAKLRGGTAFSKQEKKMLDNYTPTINDGDMRIQAKIKSLDAFLKRKRQNIINVASGNLNEGAGAPKKALTAEELIKKYGGG